MIDPDERTLLFEDSDPGIEGTRWWVTPGGGIDPGETEAMAAVREVAEETGYVLGEDELIGPVARRHVVHGYSDQIISQHEAFYLARVRRLRGRHRRAHRGGAAHPAAAPLVESRRARRDRRLDLAGGVAGAVGR